MHICHISPPNLPNHILLRNHNYKLCITHRIRMYAIYGNIYHQYAPNVSINLPYIRILQGGAPPVISWFIIPITLDITPTNPSYSTYKPT